MNRHRAKPPASTAPGKDPQPAVLAGGAQDPPREAAAFSPGQILAQRYSLERRLGQGGMGEVWLAEDRATSSRVAFKCLATEGAAQAEALRQEFARLAGILHPNIVRVHDYGFLEDGRPYFTMDYVEGAPITEVLSTADIAGVLTAVEGACAGLGAIHGAGLVHGDVKPANVLVAGGRVRSAGDVRLVDFGLSGIAESAGRPRGTPGFVAPEVLDGASPAPRSDLYGLGITLYLALTGRAPFPGRTLGEMLESQRRLRPSPLPLRALGVPDELERAILRLVDPDPGHRPASAAELWQELEPVARRLARRATRVRSQDLVRGAILARDAELGRLEAQAATAGPPALVTGPPGVGRSRFLRELALRAELSGARAVVVSCAGRMDGGREWLRRAGVVFGIGNREPSWTELLATLGGSKRALLAIEDLHLASPADLEVARQALASTVPAGVLAILSWADPAPGPNPSFQDFVPLTHGPWLGEAPCTLALPPLDEAQTASLVRLMLAGAVLPEIERGAHRLSGGIPAWIEAALLSFMEGKCIVREDGRWRVEPGVALPASLPALDAILQARLATLSREARAWLAALAELGGEAPPRAVAQVSGTGAAAQAEVLAAGLAVPERTGETALARAQPIAACEAAWRELPHEARRAMAARAAEALADRPERAAALWIAAGRAERALEGLAAASTEGLSPLQLWSRAQLRLTAREQLGEVGLAHLEEAAAVAEKAQRLQDAAALWERYAERAAGGDPLAAAKGSLRAAEARRWLADYDRATELLDESEQWLARAPDAQAGAGAALRASILNERAWVAMIRGDLPRAERCAREALEIAPADASPERFTAWNRLLAIYPRMGRLEDADRALEEALRLARAMGDEIAEGRALSNGMSVARIRGDLPAERSYLEASVHISEKHGLLSHACRDASALAGILARTGTSEEAKAGFARAESLARAAGDTSSLLGAVGGMARLELRMGRVRRAWELTRSVLAVAQRLRHLDALALSWNRLGMILSLRGRRKAAILCYRRSVRCWRSLPGRGYAAYSLVNLADMAMDRGFLDASRRLLERAFDEAKSAPAVAMWVARARARLAARLGDADEARRALAEAPSEAQVRDDAEAQGELLEASALAAFAAGDVAGAIDAYDRAAGLYRSREHLYQLGRCLAQAARAVRDTGPAPGDATARRIDWLREARAVYEKMEAPGPLREVTEDLLQLEEERAREPAGAAVRGTHDTLYEVSQLLNSILDFSELIQKALQLVAGKLGAERGLIILVDRGTGEFTPVARHGAVDAEAQASALQISTSIVRDVLRSGSTFRSDDALLDPRLSAMKSVFDLSLRSVLCAALRLRDEVIGTIYLQNRSARAAFTDADIAFLESFSNMIAVAIENARLHEDLRRANDSLLDENVSLRRQVSGQFRYADMIGRSPEMVQLHGLIERFAQAGGDVLIQGETGTGKELVGRTIHYNSPRRNRPFLSINCVAVPETLIEAELFGIEDHVATGVRAREGIFQRAEGGSVLLDEIGDMPHAMQARLLRVLQEREFTRVGGRRSIRMDVRIFAATNADLRERVRENRFRADLFFRVNRLVIQIPPLRERKPDIPLLARHFAQRVAEQMNRPVPRFSPQLLAVMERSAWPGNVRELENYIERLLVICDGPVLEPRVLPGDLEEAAAEAARPSVSGIHGFGAATLSDALASLERELIVEALRRSGGNRSRAARSLGMAEPTLRYRIRRLGVGEAVETLEDPREN